MNPSKEERIKFWMELHARSSFVDTFLFCESLIALPELQLFTLPHKALTISILVNYSRPFKQRKGVRLPESIVPGEFDYRHKSLIELRDKVVAHRDLDGPHGNFGFVSQLRVLRDAEGISCQTFSPFIDKKAAKETWNLCQSLNKAIEPSIFQFIQKYSPYLLTNPGEYIVSLDDNPHKWLTRVEETQLGVLFDASSVKI